MNSGLSTGTVRYHHAIIHKALQTAVKWGLVNRNAADGVDISRIHRKEMQIWDEYDVNLFLDLAKESPYYALFYSAIFTGMRHSELLGLQWKDVDFILCQISVRRSLHHLKDGSYILTQPKTTKSRRTIALSPSTALTLKAHKNKQDEIRSMLQVTPKDEDLVFSDIKGGPLHPNTITRAWATLARRTDVKVIRFHDARHTHASLLLKQNVHPKIVQESLGHSSISMTLDIYSHVSPGLQATAAVRFDDALIIGAVKKNAPEHSY